jgi:hypothetical protein
MPNVTKVRDIDITPAMIEAGTTELAGYGPEGFDGDEAVVCAIFDAMIRAAAPKPSRKISTRKKMPLSSGSSRALRSDNCL